jgi:hypothetical protein
VQRPWGTGGSGRQKVVGNVGQRDNGGQWLLPRLDLNRIPLAAGLKLYCGEGEVSKVNEERRGTRAQAGKAGVRSRHILIQFAGTGSNMGWEG